MMYAELYQYLLLHNKLPVPGIGTFLLEKSPAQVEFANKRINSPAYTISLQAVAASPVSGFFTWLGNKLQITERDAVLKFNDFAYDMKRQVDHGDIIIWNGVGTITKGLGGEVKLATTVSSISYEVAVPAMKVIREKAEHTVRVGEDQKTSAEMVEMLSHIEAKRSYWWAYALAIAVLSFMFIGWHFSKNGIKVSSTANNQIVTPVAGVATYKILP
jgi:hypothetical protein